MLTLEHWCVWYLTFPGSTNPLEENVINIEPASCVDDDITSNSTQVVKEEHFPEENTADSSQADESENASPSQSTHPSMPPVINQTFSWEDKECRIIGDETCRVRSRQTWPDYTTNHHWYREVCTIQHKIKGSDHNFTMFYQT